MKLSKLYEEVMSQVYMDFEIDDDGVEITALKDRKSVGKLKMTFTEDAWSEMADLIEKGDLTRQEYKKIFSRDRYAEIEELRVESSERGKGYGKMLMDNAISYAKKQGETVMYLNASPLGHGGLDLDELVNFYKSFGFRPIVGDEDNVEMFLNI